MNTKTKQRILLLLVSIFLISVATLFFSVNTVKADSFRMEGTALQTEYATGDTVEIPDLYFITESGEIKATKTIVYPSGNAYSYDEIVPEENGLYTVEYYAKDGDKVLYEERSFKVYKPHYETVGSDFSSVEYKAYKLTPNNKALNVSLDAKATFVCNELIDVTNLGASNKLISLYMTPENPGTIEFSKLNIRLTDAYNDKNFVDIFAYASSDGIRHGVTYVTAGATSQRPGGYAGGAFTSAGNYGTPTKFNFWAVNYYGLGQGDGSYSESYLVGNKLQIFFNYEERLVQTLDHSTLAVTTIADLDDPAIFSNLWNGFTTGEVILSISAGTYSASHANFAIDYIGGKSISAIKVDDIDAPVITVDQQGVVPKAVANVAYPVFKATAFDRMDGQVSVVTKAYRVSGENKAECKISNGTFTPKIAGSYILEYTATDNSGNVAVQQVNVECLASATDINIAIKEVGKVTSAYTGSKVSVASVEVDGGAGSFEVQTAVTDPEGKKVELKDGEFRPLKAGTYKVTYTATDYLLVSKSQSYDIAVTNSRDPIFQDQPNFFKYYIANREYVLPEYVAYDYSNGTQKKVDVQIEVSDELGKRTLAIDRKVTFREETIGTATITYKASATVIKQFEVTIVSVKGASVAYDMSKYFYAQGANLSSSVVSIDEDTNATLLMANESGSFEFINTLLTDSFEMEFSVDPEKTAFSKLNVYLTDSIDSTKVVKFSYRSVSKTQAVFAVNGGQEYNVGAGFTFEGNVYKVMINESVNKLTGDGTSWFDITKFNDGTDFDGFPSGKAYLKIEFEGVTDQSAIRISSINSQVMQLVALDRVIPNIVIPNVDDSSKQLGDIIVIKPAIAGDVIDQSPSITLQVKMPNGQFATAESGALLKNVPADCEYQLKLSEYGSYTITYTAKDFSNKVSTKLITITIRDEIAPEIQLNGKNVTETTVGSTIKVATATYSDNITQSEELEVMTFVITPNGKAIQLNNKSFIVSEVGTYGIRYMVYDKEGNIAIYEDSVNVYSEQAEEEVESPKEDNKATLFIILGVSVAVVAAATVTIVLVIKRRKVRV